MEKVIRVFANHAEADAAERAFFAKLSPQERLDLALDLAARYREGFGEAAERFERVCRVIPLSES
jgi:hypothetical protein